MKKIIYTILLVVAILAIIIFLNREAAVGPIVENTDTYSNSAYQFTAHIPANYSTDDQYENQVSPTTTTKGVRFTIPEAYAKGTNLGTDTSISVERLSGATSCTADLFTSIGGQEPTSITDNGMTYSVVSTTDAGAGNRYEETIYAIPSSSPCTAIRYFIHYSAIQNYPEGKVKEFDKTQILSDFDAIRRSVEMK